MPSSSTKKRSRMASEFETAGPKTEAKTEPTATMTWQARMVARTAGLLELDWFEVDSLATELEVAKGWATNNSLPVKAGRRTAVSFGAKTGRHWGFRIPHTDPMAYFASG